MLRMIHNFVSLFVFIGFCFFVYEAGTQWFYHDRFKIRSIEEFGRNVDTGMYSSLEAQAQIIIPPQYWDYISSAPAPVVPLFVAFILYLIFRLGCLSAGIKPSDLYKRRRRMS